MFKRTPAEVVDFGRRLWNKAREDDLFFLAGGVAFSILLAGVPFFLLLASGLGYVMGKTPAASTTAVTGFIRDLFPEMWGGKGSVLDPILKEIVRTKGTAGTVGAVAFVWFSTRLFGSLRVVFNRVFDVPQGHGIFLGKLYDVWLTIVASVLIVIWITASAYIAIARTRGVAFLATMGIHSDGVMAPFTYMAGRVITFALVVSIFFALYKTLPKRKVRRKQALNGALMSAALFEIARWAFTLIVHRYNPATIYTGTLAAIIVVVFWVYYGALIVIVGAAVSQVHERAHLATLKGNG